MILNRGNSSKSVSLLAVVFFCIFLTLCEFVDAKIIECADKPCKNGGECISTQRMYTGNRNELFNYECICSGRWAGFNCEEFILDDLSDKESDETDANFISDDDAKSDKKENKDKSSMNNNNNNKESAQLKLKKDQKKSAKQNDVIANNEDDSDDDFEMDNDDEDKNDGNDQDVSAVSCDLKCLNNGKCEIKKAKPYCKCRSSFRGEFCGISKQLYTHIYYKKHICCMYFTFSK